jgi:hypothetical protein
VTGRRPAVKAHVFARPRRRSAPRSSRLAHVMSRGTRSPVAVILVALLIVLILGGLGFAVHLLWWLALAALVIWLLGFFLRVGETIARPPRRRWYYW